jgi:hypothetical protein
MAENPYAPPRTAAAPAARSLSLNEAFSLGTDAFSRNWLGWTGTFVVSGIVVGLSLILCLVPALFVLPAMMWGMSRYSLDAVDGEAPSLDRAFSGFERAGDTIPPMLLLGLVLILVNLPMQVFSVGLSWAVDQDPMTQAAVSLFTTGLSLIYQAVMWTRFCLAGYLIVDQGLPATEALSQSWERTGNAWGTLAAVNLLAGILSGLGVLGCFVGVFVTGAWAMSVQAAAYRLLVPKGDA